MSNTHTLSFMLPHTHSHIISNLYGIKLKIHWKLAVACVKMEHFIAYMCIHHGNTGPMHGTQSLHLHFSLWISRRSGGDGDVVALPMDFPRASAHAILLFKITPKYSILYAWHVKRLTSYWLLLGLPLILRLHILLLWLHTLLRYTNSLYSKLLK